MSDPRAIAYDADLNALEPWEEQWLHEAEEACYSSSARLVSGKAATLSSLSVASQSPRATGYLRDPDGAGHPLPPTGDSQ